MIKAFNFVVNDKKGFNNDSFRFQAEHAAPATGNRTNDSHVMAARQPSRQPSSSVNQQAAHKCLVVRAACKWGDSRSE